jgi:4-hydroxybenzoate polyprenyltransferase
MATMWKWTATMEPSRSFVAEFRDYARERLLQPRILGLVAAVVVSAAFASRSRNPEITAPLGFLLVWTFRIWDDLEDLPYDRVHHPERTLVRSAVPRPFAVAATAALLLTGIALALATGTPQALVYGVLVAAFGLGYRLLGRAPQRRLLRAHLVLAKYPAFTVLAAWQPAPAHTALAASLLYLALCLIEISDDPALRAMREARAIAAAEGIAIAGILIYGIFL